MAARSHGKTGSKARAPAGRSARKGGKRKASQRAAGGEGRAGAAGAPLTTPTPMESIAPIGGTPPTIDGRA